MIEIVADENIPLAKELFSQFGNITLAAGRSLSKQAIENADALIVRSVTRIDAALLAGTRVRFVGTATIGIDHLDTNYLEYEKIRWCSAAGSNARSVVEWVLAAIVEDAIARRIDPRGKTLGIVGHGSIGSLLAPVADAFGLQIVLCDPPKARGVTDHVYTDLRNLCRRSDYITFHVPLIRGGDDQTVGLLTEEIAGEIPEKSLLLNASRGEVISNDVLRKFQFPMILDVFPGEPNPDRDIVKKCFIATPHIAGYSREGKIAGTIQIADQLATHLQVMLRDPAHWLACEPRLVDVSDLSLWPAIQKAIRASYDIRADDEGLRAGLALDEASWAKHFDTLRKNYPQRREFRNHIVVGAESDEMRGLLTALDFQVR